MSIPTTKASTTHVDQGSDLISNARPDIKQNIDNVNEIIDHLGTTDKVPVTFTSTIALVDWQTSYETISSNLHRRLFTDLNDIDSVVTSIDDSAGGYYEFVLPAGTYRARWLTQLVNENHHTLILYNKTDAEDTLTYAPNEVGTTAESLIPDTPFAFTLSASKTFEFRFNTPTVLQNGLAGTIRLEITRYR